MMKREPMEATARPRGMDHSDDTTETESEGEQQILEPKVNDATSRVVASNGTEAVEADAIHGTSPRQVPASCDVCKKVFTTMTRPLPSPDRRRPRCVCCKRKLHVEAFDHVEEDTTALRCRDCQEAGDEGLTRLQEAIAEKARRTTEKRKATIAAKKQAGGTTSMVEQQRKRREQGGIRYG